VIYSLTKGTSPLLVSIPHCGTFIPEDLRHSYTSRALKVEDTDWYLDDLYAFAAVEGASLLTSHISRYVIDNNRPPENTPMYAGSNNTELCPTRHFSGDKIYQNEPTDAEITRRIKTYWQEYHSALRDELARIKALHGYALLWDGHSIKSELPWLFDGVLPDLNLGTVNGESCARDLTAKLTEITTQSGYSYAVNGRFKGGYITRHYGKPLENIHAVQLEMCFSTYMEEREPYVLSEEKTRKLSPVLKQFIKTMLDWKPS
jgi:N-formylglutamate deformylase